MLAQVVSFGAAVVLARLIPPADFGYFAVVTILFLMAGAIADSGVTASLVRLSDANAAHLESAQFLSLLAGVGATAMVLVLAPLLAPILGSEIAGLLQLASPMLLITAIGAVSKAQLQRRLRFRLLGAIDASSAFVGFAVSIGLALAGVDAVALVLGPVVGQGFAVARMVHASPSPRPRRRKELGEIRRFAVPHAAAGVAATLAQNVDYAVLAARTGPATVGFYWRGYQLGVDTEQKLSGVLTTLALPLYARSADRSEQLMLRSRIIRLQTMLIAPLLIVLALEAPFLVPAIFGERWEAAVVPTQILTAAGFLATAQAGTGPLIAALGRPDAMLRWNLSNIVILAVAVYIAAPYGLVTLCASVLAVRLVRFCLGYEFLLRRIAGVPLSFLVRDLSPSLAAGAGALAMGLLAQRLLLDDLRGIVGLTGVGIVTGVVYTMLLRVLFRGAFAELSSAVGRLFRRGRAATAEGT